MGEAKFTCTSNRSGSTGTSGPEKEKGEEGVGEGGERPAAGGRPQTPGDAGRGRAGETLRSVPSDPALDERGRGGWTVKPPARSQAGASEAWRRHRTQHSRFLSESPRGSLTADGVQTSRPGRPRHATPVTPRGHPSRRGLADADGLPCAPDRGSPALASFTGGRDGVRSPSALTGQICPVNSLRGR